MPGEPAGIAVGPGDGERVRSPIGGDVTFVVTGDQSNGALTVLDVAAPAGDGPPLHVHNREDETVYIIEGDFRWKLGAELSATPAGSIVFIPRGLAHCFQCVGPQPGRMLITFAPAGMEGFFERLSSLTAFDLEAFRAAAAQHGMDVVGPPLAESDPL